MRASRASIYRALVEARAVATWMVPDGMTSQVHAFDARVGGVFRISLTYEGGTELLAVHDGVPAGISPVDNETGWRMSLDKLAALVEAG